MLNNDDKGYKKNLADQNDMTDRYVYEVTKRLPQAQMDDIELELRSLIEDMLSQRNEEEPGEAMDAVLHELGKPS